MNFIAQLHGTREGWPDNMTEEEIAVMKEHFQYLVKLKNDGKMLLAGPAMGLYGLVVLEVESEEEARQLMDKEPSVTGGVHTYTLHPFVASIMHGRPRLPDKISDKRIEHEVVVDAPRHDVWQCWTTSAGMESFLVEKATIELKIGGKYEVHFLPEAPWGERGSEGCRVLGFVPEEMISFTWSAPPQFPTERMHRTQVTVFLEAADESQTRVRLVHHGFGTDGQWDEVHTYFQKAWGNVLKALQQHFSQEG